LRLLLLAIAIPLFGLIWWWSARQLKRSQGDAGEEAITDAEWNHNKGQLDDVPLARDDEFAPASESQTGAARTAIPASELASSLDHAGVDAPGVDELDAHKPAPARHSDPKPELPIVEVSADAVSQWQHQDGPIEMRHAHVDELPAWLMSNPEPLPILAAPIKRPASAASDQSTPTSVAHGATAERAAEPATVVAAASPAANAPDAVAGDVPERVIAIRVPFQGRTVSGLRLKMWFEQEGLRFGTHQLFHKLVAGQSQFMVASLRNPGIFELKTLEARQFEGLTFFAIFPGSTILSAQSRFDELFECARRVAEQLGGVLQTDDGSEFTVAMMMALRAELAVYDAKR